MLCRGLIAPDTCPEARLGYQQAGTSTKRSFASPKKVALSKIPKHECFCSGLHTEMIRMNWSAFSLAIRCTTSGYTNQKVDIQIDWLTVLPSRPYEIRLDLCHLIPLHVPGGCPTP